MKKIFAIIRKDLLLRFISPSEWVFFLILPVVFTLILSGGTGGQNQDVRRVMPVVDEANSPLSAQIFAELEKSTLLRPERASRQQAESRFSERQVLFWLLIPAQVNHEALAEGSLSVRLVSQPNNLTALAAQRSLQAALRTVSAQAQAARHALRIGEENGLAATAQEKQAYFTEMLALAAEMQKDAPERLAVTRSQVVDEIQYDPRANSSAGQLITWVFIPLFGISALLAYERSTGTLGRLLTTPTSQAVFLLGTIGGQVLMALVQMLLLVGFGILFLQVGWGREPLGLAVLLVSAALAAAAIGTAMGTLVRSESQANNLSILLGMVMALLGGCWYPLELFPLAVQAAVRVLPTTWAMQGMVDLTLRGQGLQGILLEAGVLLGFAALFFGIGIARFRKI